jgi:hypothetical protein
VTTAMRRSAGLLVACLLATSGLSASAAPAAGISSNQPPCRYSAGTWVEMLRPTCGGPVGTIITLEVTRKIPAPLTGVTFAPMQAANPARPSYARTPPNNVVPFTVPVAFGPNTAPGTKFDGTTVGSRYTVTAPRLLCVGGRGAWAWQMTYDPRFPGKSYYIDFFVVQC